METRMTPSPLAPTLDGRSGIARLAPPSVDPAPRQPIRVHRLRACRHRHSGAIARANDTTDRPPEHGDARTVIREALA
jgi:hypothetical protein